MFLRQSDERSRELAWQLGGRVLVNIYLLSGKYSARLRTWKTSLKSSGEPSRIAGDLVMR